MIDLGAFGQHPYVLEQPRFMQPAGHAVRVGGALRPRNEAAKNAHAAALFVLAPTVDILKQSDVLGERATKLAERLRHAGAITNPVPVELTG